MLADNWRQVRNVLQPITAHISEQEKRIDLITGGLIDMWSLDNHDAARGRKYKRVIVNEAAMIGRLQEAWEMVIRSTLADLQGDAFFDSTPRGFNYFHTLYQQADNNHEWCNFHYTTYDNPFIAREEIESLRAMMPERTFQQEILAEFIEDGAYFQGVPACAVLEQPDCPDQHVGHRIVMGVDWARVNDWTVLTVGCTECVKVVDWQRFNKIDYHFQIERLIELAERWKVSTVLAESNSIGDPNIGELRARGVPVRGFQTTATSKPELIEALHMALIKNNLKVPKSYADELLSYEIKLRKDGAPSFGAPDGLHDDRVISLALCWRSMIRRFLEGSLIV